MIFSKSLLFEALTRLFHISGTITGNAPIHPPPPFKMFAKNWSSNPEYTVKSYHAVA